jgi:hypothetical protein
MHTAVEVNVDPVPPEAATASLVHLRRLIAPPPRRRAATATPTATDRTPSPECRGDAAKSFVGGADRVSA